MSSLATTEASTFSHISGTVVGRERHADLCDLGLYLHGHLLIWFSSIAGQVGLVIVTLCSHSFLI